MSIDFNASVCSRVSAGVRMRMRVYLFANVYKLKCKRVCCMLLRLSCWGHRRILLDRRWLLFAANRSEGWADLRAPSGERRQQNKSPIRAENRCSCSFCRLLSRESKEKATPVGGRSNVCHYWFWGAVRRLPKSSVSVLLFLVVILGYLSICRSREWFLCQCRSQVGLICSLCDTFLFSLFSHLQRSYRLYLIDIS